jgi:hypothetical protein
MRFLGLILGLFLASALVYGIIFFWGQGRAYPAFTNQFLQQKTPWVLVPENLKPLAGEIPWVEVFQDTDGLLKISDTQQLFSDWLSKEKPKFLALDVINSKEQIHEQISSLLPEGYEEHVLVQSQNDVVLASLKNLRPRWAYGASIADQVRWKSFDSLGLIGAVTHSRDVYVTPLIGRTGENLNTSIVNELRRRNLFLIIGPLSTAEEVQAAKKFAPDGYLLLNPDLRSQIH